MALRRQGSSSTWHFVDKFVDDLPCRRTTSSTKCHVDELPCRRSTMSTNYPVDEVSCRRTTLSTKCHVDELPCRRSTMSTNYLVDEVSCRRKFFDKISFRQTALSTKCFSTKKPFDKIFSTKLIRRSAVDKNVCRPTTWDSLSRTIHPVSFSNGSKIIDYR